MRIITGEVLKYDNAHVFCFYDDHELVTNLDNFSDLQHYSGQVSDMILAVFISYDILSLNFVATTTGKSYGGVRPSMAEYGSLY